MPEAIQYILETQNKKAYDALEEKFNAELKARTKMFKRNWAYYNGDHDQPLTLQRDNYNDNVIVNHVMGLADRIVGFMIGDGISFDAGGDTEQGEDDDAITDLWDQNNGELLQDGLILGGVLEGHCAVRITPRGGMMPKVTRIQQQHYSAFWNPFDTDDVLWHRLQHISGEQGKRIDYVRGMVTVDEVDHQAQNWTELVYNMTTKDDGITAPRWKLDTVQTWPFEWAPIVAWQNSPTPNTYYGKAEVKDAIRLNDTFNFVLSNTNRIIKHHASPKTVGTGFTADQILETQVGGLFSIANEAAKVYNLELQSDGALIQWLTNIVTSGLWESGGMVDSSTIKDAVGQLTNFGLQVLFANAIKRTEKKRVLYGMAFEHIIQYAMELAGQAIPESVVTIWPEVLPTDDSVEVQTLTTELESGIISKETYRSIRGYDNETEMERLESENTQGDVGAGILGLLTNNGQFNRGQ